LGQAWFDTELECNVIGFADLANRYHVTYDNKVDDAFHVHTENGEVLWERQPNGKLYTYRPSDEYRKMIAETKNPVKKSIVAHQEVATATQLLETVKDNCEGFTKREVEGAKRARKLLHASGFPSLAALKQAVRVNQFKNCDVTYQDLVNMESIFGKDVATLKGKTVNRKTPAVVEDHIELPRELKIRNDLVLCMDIMHINKIPMMASVDKQVRFRSLRT